jgi:hypothetical protein
MWRKSIKDVRGEGPDFIPGEIRIRPLSEETLWKANLNFMSPFYESIE